MSEEINTNCDDAKVVLIGEAGVGKTCIIKQFVHHTFDENEVSSISSQFSTRIINVPETPKAIRFDLWDTAGQEKYRSVAKIFYKDARIVIFVYDILNYKSFEELKNYWINQVKSNCQPNCIFAIVGNKNDLYAENEVSEDEAKELANSLGAIFSFTSAKNNIGIDTLFENIGKKCINPDYNYNQDEIKKKELYEKKKNNKKKKKQIDEEEDEEDDGVNNYIPQNNNNIKLTKSNDKNNDNKKKKRKFC